MYLSFQYMFIPKQLNRLTASDFQSDIYHPQQKHINLIAYEHQVYQQNILQS